MATNLFVGSLSWNVTSDELKDFFAQVGTVVSANVITDRDSGRSKGFGFVEMSSDDEAKKAVEELNGKELDGRSITVNEARPKEDKPRNNNYNNNRY
jgi:cold-inducible RNA-binding protein